LLPPPDPVDAVTQLKLMIATLPASSRASDDLRSGGRRVDRPSLLLGPYVRWLFLGRRRDFRCRRKGRPVRGHRGAGRCKENRSTVWASENFELAKTFGYTQPVTTGQNRPGLRAYETTARTVARSQAGLAAARLANPLNEMLKLSKAWHFRRAAIRRCWRSVVC
jgi:hypothetical protein